MTRQMLSCRFLAMHRTQDLKEQTKNVAQVLHCGPADRSIDTQAPKNTGREKPSISHHLIQNWVSDETRRQHRACSKFQSKAGMDAGSRMIGRQHKNRWKVWRFYLLPPICQRMLPNNMARTAPKIKLQAKSRKSNSTQVSHQQSEPFLPPVCCYSLT